MAEIEREILEIENRIKSLEMNDNVYKKHDDYIKDGMSKGLLYDFFHPNCNYRGTMISDKIIKKEDYDDFQKYIDRCEKEEYDKYKQWCNDIINSGVEYSKDELKYRKNELK
jgi:hypothetical protein